VYNPFLSASGGTATDAWDLKFPSHGGVARSDGVVTFADPHLFAATFENWSLVQRVCRGGMLGCL